MNRSQVILEINGENVTGWEAVSMTFDMEELSSTFSLSLYDKAGGISSRLNTGSEVNLHVENPDVGGREELLIPGFLTTSSRSVNETDDSLEITGADKLVDLLDCSAIHEAQTWTGKKFSAIVADLLAPFGLQVDRSALTDDPKIEKFTLQSGETAFSAVERLCRSQAVLPLSTFEGNLLLGYAAGPEDKAAVDLEVGVNVLSLTESISWEDRFSEYVGIGQFPGGGKKWSKELLQGRRVAVDAGVNRYRPYLLISESKADNKILAKRVAWEAQIRSGRATEYTATVSGWYQKDGTGRPLRLWRKNERVNLKYSDWDVDAERLITRVEFTLNESGELTTLTLKHPDIFKADPGEKVDLT
jgi:prophage tail gpP-like protein